MLGETIGKVPQTMGKVREVKSAPEIVSDLSEKARATLCRLTGRQIANSSDLAPKEIAEILNRIFR